MALTKAKRTLMELILFIGIQASGKSTFYKRRFFDTHVRINLDMLKTRNREKILYEACLESKTKIVVDNTNPVPEDRKHYITKAKLWRYRIIGYYFSTDIDLAMGRNKERKIPIPAVAIVSTYKKLEKPSYDEGFDELYVVKTENNDFIIERWEDGI